MKTGVLLLRTVLSWGWYWHLDICCTALVLTSTITSLLTSPVNRLWWKYQPNHHHQQYHPIVIIVVSKYQILKSFSFKRFARQDFYSTFPQQLEENLDGWFSIPYEYRWWDQASTQQIWLEAVLNLWLDSLSGLHSWLLCFLFRVLWFVIKYVTFIKRLPFESWQLCPPVSDVPSFSLLLPYWARIKI